MPRPHDLVIIFSNHLLLTAATFRLDIPRPWLNLGERGCGGLVSPAGEGIKEQRAEYCLCSGLLVNPGL